MATHCDNYISQKSDSRQHLGSWKQRPALSAHFLARNVEKSRRLNSNTDLIGCLLTSSAGLDEKHLWFVLEQRTACVVKHLKHPVQLKMIKCYVYSLNVFSLNLPLDQKLATKPQC